MNFLQKFDVKTSTILKIAGLAIVLLIVITLAFRLVGSSFNAVTRSDVGQAPAYYYDGSGKDFDSAGLSTESLSMRNIAPRTPDSPAGDDAEDYEVTDYYTTIETRTLDTTCAAITDLKGRDYVIFENANEYESGCTYRFKVKNEHVEEILGFFFSFRIEISFDFIQSFFGDREIFFQFFGGDKILHKDLLRHPRPFHRNRKNPFLKFNHGNLNGIETNFL